MFDIMFMHAPKAERNSATHGSKFKLARGASSLEQMRLLGHVSTKQRSEIQCEMLEFSDKHKLLCDLNYSLKPNRRNTVCNETVRRLFDLHIALVYHGFTVVTLIAL